MDRLLRNMRKLPPIARLVLSIGVQNLNQSDFSSQTWRRGEVLAWTNELDNEILSRTALTAHIFFDESVPDLLRLVKKYSPDLQFFVSTPSERILNSLQADIGHRKNVCLALCKNRGRNFGPMLVEFAQELLNYEFVAHFHSKLSKHARRPIAFEWKRRLTIFFIGENWLVKNLNLFDVYDDLGLIYPDVSDLIRRLNYRWGPSLSSLRSVPFLASLVPNAKPSDYVMFPAGGMFIVRTEAMAEVLSYPWTYELFPPELGQLDGTLQHGLERLIGFYTKSNGWRHGIFDHERRQSYLVAKASEVEVGQEN